MRTDKINILVLCVTVGLGIALDACSGSAGGIGSGTETSARPELAALPAVAGRAGAPPAAVAGRRMRRPSAQPTCSSSAEGWLGLTTAHNVAGDTNAGVAAGAFNNACGFESFVGAGLLNGVDSNSQQAAILAGTQNAIVGSNFSVVAGGSTNSIDDPNGTSEFVGSGLSNQISQFSSFAVIAGGDGNSITGGAGSLIGGGYNNADVGGSDVIAGGMNNAINDAYWALIGSGSNNAASANYATIGGGSTNGVTQAYGFVGGGAGNAVSAGYGAIAGGQGNKVATGWGAIGGGYGNEAGEVATVPGGKDNLATGEGSFAAGIGSTAGYTGDFVWSDFASGATALKGTAANQFLARASGGVTFYSSPKLTSGVKLAAGSGTWSSLSDRNAKTGIAAVSDDDILARVSALPISEWSYATERGVRHVGPMAQDFYAAFNVGEDDRHITSIDEDGVALAAIKALNARQTSLTATLRQKDRAIQSLQRQDSELQRSDASLRTKLLALKSEVDALSATRR